MTVALGETANVPFDGTLLRTSGISGRVSVEGMGLDDVEVVLAGAADATAMTSGGGQYAFAGLAEGTYVVSMMNPNEAAYAFETMSHTVVLGDSESAIRNFDGTHTRTASVSGMAYIDEAPADKMYTANEPALAHAGIPVVLQGPGVNDVRLGATDEDGSYAFEGLMAGSYRVLVNMTEEVAATIAAAGFAYKGDLTGEVVNVEAGGSMTVNFPFGITMQTVATGARMGGGGHFGLPVEGVELVLYARADMTDMLGEATTDAMGLATFNFARADNTGPAGNDNIVFVSVKSSGHDALVPSGNEYVEIVYDPTSRLYAADEEKEVATLVNVMANFQFWVKSDMDARSGDMGLGGVHTAVFMGEVTADSEPLMVEDEDGEMVNATMPTDDGSDNMDDLGKSSLSYMVDPAMLPAAFAVVVAPGQSRELYEQSDPLVHVHTGLEHPDINSMEMNDLGPIYLTWTTQALTVGVYRETDDEPGFSNYQSKVAGGDQRPTADVSKELMVELMTENSRGRLTRYAYKRFDAKGARTIEVANPMSFSGGLARFVNLPADQEFTVRFHAGSDRKAVVDASSVRNGRDVDTYGDDLEDGMSVGAFGDMGGAGPEVRLCPMSSSSELDMCSTFAYQWASGSISGAVTRRGVGVASATVNLEAITDNHSPSDNTKTSRAAATKGNYSFSGVQDGEYWVRTPATADNKADSARVAFYHDETEDDDADDGIIGNPATHSESFDVTALRLEIKGYVANDGQEGDNEDPDLDNIVRGDEAVAGIQLELLTITRISSNRRDTTFKVHQTVTTDDDGSYSFDDVVEGSSYYVRATGTGDYRAAEASAKDGFSRRVAADEYPAVEEGEFALPYWNYNDGKTMMSAVTVSNATGTVSASFVNFALLYVDGSISGRVREASGNPGNITIELIRCDTYDAGDAECNTYDRDNFPTQTTETKRNGAWEFNDLLEGWYEVYVGEAGYLAANIDDDDKIDDDGATESADMHTGLVKGRRDLAAGNNFYVYDNGLDDDDDLGSDGVVIKGTTDPEEDPEELTSSSVITWASKNVTVTPDIHRDASFAATTESRGARPWPQSRGVATVEPDYNATGSDDEGMVKATEITVSVTAENGYDDTDYTYTVMRAAPVGNTLEAGDFTVEAPAGGEIMAAFGQIDQFTVNVAENADELTFTVELEDIERQVLMVSMGGDEVMPSDRKRADGADEQRYEVELDDGANTIDLMVTSEDDEERSYQLVVRRDERSGDATLSALSLSAGTLSPAFNAATTSYTASVGNAVSEVTVTATANHAGARVAQSPDNPVSLNVGTNRITVTVTAEDGTTGAYTVTVTRDPPGPSSDATLKHLSLSNAVLSPTFAEDVMSYTADVGNAVTSTTVTARASHSEGRVVIKPDNPVALDVGPNTITVTVTAEDASTTQDYTVTVTRAEVPQSTDATLSSLSLSGVTLNEPWAATTYAYTAAVENSVESTMVDATATDEDGATVTLPDPNPVPLAVGSSNVITVTVTAEAGNTQDYTVTVTRAGVAQSTDATLSSLSLSGVTLNEPWAATTYAYTAAVENSVESTMVDATATDDGAEVTLPDPNPVPLAVGSSNVITVTVTAEAGNTRDYTVTVTRAGVAQSTDATLSSLSLSGVTLNEPWAATTYAYTAAVENSVESTMVDATATDDGAEVTLPDPNPVPLAVGSSNVITVTVTAEAGNTRDYTVTVTRAGVAQSTDATLSSLSLSGVTLNEPWAATTYAYTAAVENSVESTMVAATATDDGAEVTLPAPNPVDLVVGDTEITVTVTAEAGNTQDYTVTVTREAPASNADPTITNAARQDLDENTMSVVTLAATDDDDDAITGFAVVEKTGSDHAAFEIDADNGLAFIEAPDHENPTDVGGDASGDNIYYVTVEVTSGTGDRVRMAEQMFIVTVNDVDEPPSAPGAPMVEGASTTSLSVSWDAPANSGPAIVDYDLRHRVLTDPVGGDWTEMNDISETTATVTGLDEGTEYEVQVNAHNDEGTSEWSASGSGSTDVADVPAIEVSTDELTVREGEDAAYTIALATEPAENVTVTVDLDTELSNAGASVTPATVVFTPSNWSRARQIVVEVANNTAAAADVEGKIMHSATTVSGDTDYDIAAADGPEIAMTVIDDDRNADAGIVLSETALTVEEGDAEGETYTIKLAAEPSGTVTVTVAGFADNDVSVSPDVLSFTADDWETAQDVTVTAEEDDDAIDNDVVMLTHTAAGADYVGVSGPEVAVTITDDDVAGVTVSASALEIREGDDATYTVVLTAEPKQEPVTVSITSGNSDIWTNLSSLSFNRTNWSTAQTVTVNGRQDTDDTEADDAGTLVQAVTSSGDDYNSSTAVQDVRVRIKDDELAGVVVSHTALNAVEGTAVTYTLSLTQIPENGEAVTITVRRPGDVGISPSTAEVVLNSGNWDTGEVITLTPATDNIDDAGTVIVSHVVESSDTTDGKYKDSTASDVVLTVSDPS